jgi:hypothetical protein
VRLIVVASMIFWCFMHRMLGRGLSIVRQALALIMVSVTLGLLKAGYKRLTNHIKRGLGPLFFG